MKIIVAKIAQQEFVEAKEFYEIEQAGLFVFNPARYYYLTCICSSA